MKLIPTSIAYAIVLPSMAMATLLWPVPQHVEWGQTELELDANFYISGPNVTYLQNAIDRYTILINQERWIPVQVVDDHGAPLLVNTTNTTLKALNISIENNDTPLEYDVDESYALHVPLGENAATLVSKNVWGAIRGLETFSQLIQGRPDLDENGDLRIMDYEEQELKSDEVLVFEGLYIPKAPITIEDSPAFPHRGLMLDTSRNYFPVKDILRTIDAMAYNKMNVFHWHITDSHSFPLRLDNSPELANQGAYILHQRRLVYTTQDVRDVVNYAYERGVRVIPEIDMPAHTGSWGKAYKDITTCTDEFYLDPSGSWEKKFAAEPGTGQLNPVLVKTYEIVEKVISEAASLFTDSWFHGGGDEPIYRCWEQDEHVQAYMKAYNATGYDLLDIFLQKELDMIRNSSKTAIIWEDPVTHIDLPIGKDVVLQSWFNPVKEAVKKGYKVIASNANFWYLDCGHGGWGGNDNGYDEQTMPEVPSEVAAVLAKHDAIFNYNPNNWGGRGSDWCSPYKTWQRIYSYDLTYNLTEAEASNVLGGEVALWTEQVDSTTLDTRLWPRSSAAAEVLWSGRFDQNKTKRDIGEAMPRIFDWRYRLQKRGIQTEAMQPLWCGQNPHMCDITYPSFLKTKQ